MLSTFHHLDDLDLPPFDPHEPVRMSNDLDPSVDSRDQLNQYFLGEQIGKGKHGDVYVCKDESTESVYDLAVKSVRKRDQRDKMNMLRRIKREDSTLNSIRKEIAIMKKCRHSNLVRLVEVIDDPHEEKIYIIMENLAGGPVEWVDVNKEPILTISQTRRILRDTILGLEYLHHEGIIHRDIKPANLLYTRDRRHIKIIDFGVAHYIPPARLKGKDYEQNDGYINPAMFPNKDLLKVAGTPSFLAPEVVWFSSKDPELSPSPSYDTISPSIVEEGDPAGPSITPPKQRPPVTKAVDIWALGVTFYCFLFGHLPFKSPPSANDNNYHNEFILYQQICTQDWQVDEFIGFDRIVTGGRYPGNSTSEPASIIRLLDQMLQKEPKHRVSLSSIKENPWMLQDIKHPKEWSRLTSPCMDTGVAEWVKTASKKLLNLIPRAR